MSYRGRDDSRGYERDYDRRDRSRSPQYRERRNYYQNRGGSEVDKKESTCLFVGNLPFHFRERDVADYFERCGRTRNITVGYNRRTQQSKGYAFVEFEDRRDAEDAFERFQGYEMEGRRLRIDWDAGLDRKVQTGVNRPRRSPSRRSPRRSPKKYRSPSPRRRSPSPRRRSPSPARRSGSPARRSRSASPTREAAGSPAPKVEDSPKRTSRSPSPKND